VNLPAVGEPADLPADLPAEGMEAWRHGGMEAWTQFSVQKKYKV
jgi:hypothetical protein